MSVTKTGTFFIKSSSSLHVANALNILLQKLNLFDLEEMKN